MDLFAQFRLGAGGMPLCLNFVSRWRTDPLGGPAQEVGPVAKPPAGYAMVATDRFHLANRNGGGRYGCDPFTLRPAELFYPGVPTTRPAALMGGIEAVNIHPNPARGALGKTNVTQEYGGATIYDGYLPMMPLWRAMPYGRIPPKLPGLSTKPSALTVSGFVDPYAIANYQSKQPVGTGLRWTP